jgi:hypothetical protein
MTIQWRQVPTYEQPLVVRKNTSASLYRWFQDTDQGRPPAQESAVALTSSPFIYTAPRKGFLIVTGGTVSTIAFSRSGTFYSVGQTSGMINVNQGDQVKITYSAAPTLTWVPT